MLNQYMSLVMTGRGEGIRTDPGSPDMEWFASIGLTNQRTGSQAKGKLKGFIKYFILSSLIPEDFETSSR